MIALVFGWIALGLVAGFFTCRAVKKRNEIPVPVALGVKATDSRNAAAFAAAQSRERRA